MDFVFSAKVIHQVGSKTYNCEAHLPEILFNYTKVKKYFNESQSISAQETLKSQITTLHSHPKPLPNRFARNHKQKKIQCALKNPSIAQKDPHYTQNWKKYSSRSQNTWIIISRLKDWVRFMRKIHMSMIITGMLWRLMWEA